jgi:1,2-diacylglycerol 3-alpha-glucosyltransferase
VRIGLLCDMYTPHISGVTSHIRQHKAACEALGHEVWVVTFGGRDHHDDEDHVIRSGGMAWGSTGWNFALSYSAEARRTIASLDVAHLHHPVTSALLAMPICRSKKIPTVFTVHSRYDLYASTYTHWVPESVRQAVVRRHLARLTRRVDRVIAPSTGSAEWLASFADFSDVHVIPSGIDVSKYAVQRVPQHRGALHIPQDALVYCSVGRLAFEKNLPLLVDAFAQVSARVPNAWLLLVGDGPARARVEELASEAGIGHRIVFTGNVDHERLGQTLAAADVFVSASVTETQGLAALEAMAAGMPAVTLRAPGFEDMVSDRVDGFLAERTAASLADRMARLADKDTLAEMSARARESAARHDGAKASQEIVAVYEELVAARG